ncbi:hypothetical protein BC628DRAFT_1193105 [Trametes gibbosa]|nr:hypothetical protein BC628DRAFT_1193105 [Trametes gibbosa]
MRATCLIPARRLSLAIGHSLFFCNDLILATHVHRQPFWENRYGISKSGMNILLRPLHTIHSATFFASKGHA